MNIAEYLQFSHKIAVLLLYLLLYQVQFIAIMVHAFQLLFIDCNYPRAFVWFIGMHAVMFFFLFNEFYKEAYQKKRKVGVMEATVRKVHWNSFVLNQNHPHKIIVSYVTKIERMVHMIRRKDEITVQAVFQFIILNVDVSYQTITKLRLSSRNLCMILKFS